MLLKKTATLFLSVRGGGENIHCDMPFMRVAAEQAYLKEGKGKLFSGYEERILVAVVRVTMSWRN